MRSPRTRQSWFYPAALVLALAALLAQNDLLRRLARPDPASALLASGQPAGTRLSRAEPAVEPGQQELIQRLRNENKELHKLRNEVHQLREEKQLMENLRSQVQQLQAQNAELRARAGGAALPAPAAPDRQGAWLGVAIRPVQIAGGFVSGGGGRYSSGIQVVQIQPNTPAAQSALATNDVITTLDGKAIGSVDEFRNEMRLKSPGQSVTLEIIRGGTNLMLQVPTGAVP